MNLQRNAGLNFLVEEDLFFNESMIKHSLIGKCAIVIAV